MSDETVYSSMYKGAKQNHNLSARFDLTNGCLGISQPGINGQAPDRILLSRRQVTAMLKFIKKGQ